MMYLFILKLILVILATSNIVLSMTMNKSLTIRQIVLITCMILITTLVLALVDLALLQMIVEQLAKPLRQYV